MVDKLPLKKKKPLSIKQIEKELRNYDGNMTAVAKHFGVTRQAISKRVNNSETLRNLTDELKSVLIDKVSNALIENALSGDTTAAIFFLKSQAGWTEKQVVEQKSDNITRIIIEHGNYTD